MAECKNLDGNKTPSGVEVEKPTDNHEKEYCYKSNCDGYLIFDQINASNKEQEIGNYC